jgi:uncharacterized membrane protein YraQ (UPF0718 family)
MRPKKEYILTVLFFLVWLLLYNNLEVISRGFGSLIDGYGIDPRFKSALEFFVFEVPKVFLLLILIIFIVGIIKSFFSAEKTRKALEGKPVFVGNVLAGVLGIFTPFCSCSAIPLFLGFIEAGIPLGVTFSFLIAAPMINEVALVMLFGLFGWQTALIYMSTGLVIAIFSGWIIHNLHLEKFVEPWVYQVKSGQASMEDNNPTLDRRIGMAYQSVIEIVGKIWIFIVLGIGVGSGIHGFVPENYLASFMGKDSWYAVPLSVLIGIPLYSNAAGVIPIVQSLMAKGASLGTSLAFMMAVIGLSLPEMIILRKVLKIQMIFIFIGILAVGIIAVGYLFNFIY